MARSKGRGARSTDKKRDDAPPAPEVTPAEVTPDEAPGEDFDVLEDLPWLHAIEEEDGALARQRTRNRWIIAAVAGLVLIAALGLYSMRPDSTEADRMQSASADDVVPPNEEPVTSDVMRTESAPDTPALDTPRVSVQTARQKAPAQEASRSSAPTRAPPVSSKQEVAHEGQEIQLASYFSNNRAEQYWGAVSARHKALAQLDHRIVPAPLNGKTVYRLRATGVRAHETCQSLRLAGVACLIVGH